MQTYYVLYRYYSEYNQFEGSWDKDWDSFDSEEEAKDFMKRLKDNSNYRDLIGPLTTL